MKLGVLFSGGKDSCFALRKAMDEHEIACLITVFSENKESFMFHVPNIHMTEMQAEAICLPLIKVRTKGEKEKELSDLETAINQAKEEYSIEGIVTGAVRSIYQATRIQKICNNLGLWCFNPLWLSDEIELLNDILEAGMKVVLSGVFAYPLEREMLGREIDMDMISSLKSLMKKYEINPAGEGGELETTVLDAPFFKKRIEIIESEVDYENYSGTFTIKKARLMEK
jgi:diphthine-ammonia ligase